MPAQLPPGRRLRQEAVRHGLRHQHLDEGERAHIGGGGEREADEPELGRQRAEEACPEGGAPGRKLAISAVRSNRPSQTSRMAVCRPRPQTRVVVARIRNEPSSRDRIAPRKPMAARAKKAPDGDAEDDGPQAR